MYKAIAPGAIGVGLPFEECVPAAAKLGFEGIYIHPPEVDNRGIDETKAFLAEHNMRAAGFNFPVKLFGDEEAFTESLAQLASASSKSAV